MLRTVVWYFSNGWLFSPFHPPSSEVCQHGSCMIQRNSFYHWTYHSSSNTIHKHHEGEWVGDNRTHSSTFHRQTSSDIPCNTTTQSCLYTFSNRQSNYDWNARSWYTTEAIYFYIVITCACLIGNKVLVIRNRNVTRMARLRHCIISLVWVPSRHEQAWDGFWFYGIARFWMPFEKSRFQCH